MKPQFSRLALIFVPFNANFLPIIEHQCCCLAGRARLDGSIGVRQLSILAKGWSRNTPGIRSLHFAKPHRLAIGFVVCHIRVRPWLRWPSELVPIVVHLAAIVSAQLFRVYFAFPCRICCDGLRKRAILRV